MIWNKMIFLMFNNLFRLNCNTWSPHYIQDFSNFLIESSASELNNLFNLSDLDKLIIFEQDDGEDDKQTFRFNDFQLIMAMANLQFESRTLGVAVRHTLD